MPLVHHSGRRVRRWTVVTLASALLVSACGADAGVVSLSASPTPNTDGTSPAGADASVDESRAADPAPVDPPPVTVDVTDEPPPTTEAAPPPEPTVPAIVEPELNVDIPIDAVVDVDPGKPPREYDAFVAVALTDIDQWWARVYPAVYGTEFVPLEGGIYAGYPQRQSPLPGCGQPVTDYEDLSLFVAFYCEIGDFMVYDDSNEDVLAPLATEFGPAVMGVVLAHEYGHAVQARIGALDRRLATILTEQQADCFAGAWTGQAYRGESELLRLGDADVRAGLIAMLSVRDPVGTNQFVPGGHGAAFDRIGAFQVGFVDGPARCAELLDDPLALVPNEFIFQSDLARGGDASYDCSDDPSPNCRPAPEFLAEDLDHYWDTELGGFDPVTAIAVDTLDALACAEPTVITDTVVTCAEDRTVRFHEPTVRELYAEFGDFTIGYYYGVAWAEFAQQALGSELVGEPRALLNDCYAGAWVRDITPDANGDTPRQGDRDGDGTLDGISSSPGDLDEAIRMAVLEGDDGANVDEVGTAFEKIAAIRVGAIGGLTACEAEFAR
ncbi:neutral zinc metallopeptidase [Ilumatobacter sp.]|uniref:neutral zinc metallopeptidase n=1 Tax=Ilumatobacter sp. TaxID=1967498 RepID=UPI003AF8A61B